MTGIDWDAELREMVEESEPPGGFDASDDDGDGWGDGDDGPSVSLRWHSGGAGGVGRGGAVDWFDGRPDAATLVALVGAIVTAQLGAVSPAS